MVRGAGRREPGAHFLNSDVEASPDFIEPLAASFEDPAIFSASPLILDAKQNVSNVTISIPYFRRGKIRYEPSPLQHLVDHTPALPHPWYTLFPPGAAFAVDRLRFIELQGFDDLFKPFYYEDTDLGFRAWRRGWQCIVVPASRVTHYHSGTIGRAFKKFKVSAIRRRNRLFYLWKNLTSAKLLRQHILFQLLRICYRPFCLDGMDLIATILAVPGFRRAGGRRRTEQACTVNSEEKIFRIIRSAAQANQRAIESAVPSGAEVASERMPYREGLN